MFEMLIVTLTPDVLVAAVKMINKTKRHFSLTVMGRIPLRCSTSGGQQRNSLLPADSKLSTHF